MKGLIMERSNGIWAQSHKTKLFVCLSFLLVALLGAFAVVNGTSLKAQAADETASSNVVNVKVTNNGVEGGAAANLERSTYVEGDQVVLTWKGAAVGNDFVIPTKISYTDDGITWNTSTLISVDQMQVDNDRYSARMNQSGNMTSYDSLKNYVTATHTISLGSAVATKTDVVVTWQKVAPVYRMYNMITSEHLFTTNKTEYDGFLAKDLAGTDVWICEGISWLAPKSGTVVHRLYNPTLGAMGHSSHYYTADQNEIATLTGTAGWVDDGVEQQFYSGGNTAIYTCYNGLLGSSHHYTTSKTEWEGLKAHGWDLEDAKNGTNGVFQGVIGTSWSYSDNYYKVEHAYEDGTIFATQWVEGKAGQKTAAKALSIPGYEVGNIGSTTIDEKNGAAVQVTYEKATYTLTLKNANGTNSDTVQKVKYQAATNVATPNDTTSLKFKGWFLDEACTVPYNAGATMPAGNVTLYAKWEDSNTGVTSYAIHHKYVALSGGEDDWVLTTVQNATVGQPTQVANYVKNRDGFEAHLPQDVTVEAGGRTTVTIEYTRLNYTVTFDYDNTIISLDQKVQTVQFGAIAKTPTVTLVNEEYDLKTVKYVIKGTDTEWVYATPVSGNVEVSVTIDKKTVTPETPVDPVDPTDPEEKTITSYVIEHYKKDLNKDTYTLAETDTVEDVEVGSTTDVASKLKAYAGFGTANYEGEVTVEADAKTVVKVYYNRNIYTVKIDFNKSHLNVEQDTFSVEYESLLTAPTVTELDSQNYTFDKWAELRVNEDWSQSYIAWSFDTPITGNITLKALTKQVTSTPTTKPQPTRVDYTINFNGNGATSGSMASTPRTVGDNGRLPDNKFFKNNGQNYYGFRWWLGPDGTKYEGGYTGDINGVKNGDVVTLTAVWTDEVLTGDYWFAPASKITTGNTTATANQKNPDYTHPYNNVIKTHDEFQKDINKLQQYLNGVRTDEVVEVYNLYYNFMVNDNYHLYTRYNSTDWYKVGGSPYNENDFAECRIIQIGAHLSTGDGKGTNNGQYSDGKTVTFQMTHAIYDPLPLFVDGRARETRYGWDYSSAQTDYLSTNGKIGKLFTTKLTGVPNIKTNKWYAKEVKDWASMQESKDNVLWLLSASEIADIQQYSNASNIDKTNVRYEGNQYDFWKRLGITSDQQNNPALQALGKRRNGDEINYTYYWTVKDKWSDIWYKEWSARSESYAWTRTFARNVDPDYPWHNNVINTTGFVNDAHVTCGFASYCVAFAFGAGSV